MRKCFALNFHKIAFIFFPLAFIILTLFLVVCGMSSTNGVAVSAETLNKLNQFKQRAAQRKNLLQNSNASSDMVSNDLLTSTVASKQSVLPTPQFAKPQIQLNPAVQALKLTPKRRASIVIERKPPVSYFQ